MSIKTKIALLGIGLCAFGAAYALWPTTSAPDVASVAALPAVAAKGEMEPLALPTARAVPVTKDVIVSAQEAAIANEMEQEHQAEMNQMGREFVGEEETISNYGHGNQLIKPVRGPIGDETDLALQRRSEDEESEQI